MQTISDITGAAVFLAFLGSVWAGVALLFL